MLALGDLLDKLLAERRQVVGVAACEEPPVRDDPLIDPVPARVTDVSLQRRVRGQRPALHHVRLHQRPRAVADHGDRLFLFKEPTHEVHCLLAAAQGIRSYSAARHDQGVIVVWGDVREGLLYGESLTRVDIAVHGLGITGLNTYDVNFGAGVFDGLLRLGELDLLAAHGGKQYRYLASLQLVRHVRPPLQIVAYYVIFTQMEPSLNKTN